MFTADDTKAAIWNNEQLKKKRASDLEVVGYTEEIIGYSSSKEPIYKTERISEGYSLAVSKRHAKEVIGKYNRVTIEKRYSGEILKCYSHQDDLTEEY